MGIEALIAKLRHEVVTPIDGQALQEKPSDISVVTPITPVTPGRTITERVLAPDPGDWRGEVEKPQEPSPRAEPDWWRPKPLPAGSLVARLVASGATVQTWSTGHGGQASIEAPASIPAELVAEVERRGWRIIPGGRPNPEAEHDSWAFGGVPAAEFDR
jgi:hypothetical protein